MSAAKLPKQPKAEPASSPKRRARRAEPASSPKYVAPPTHGKNACEHTQQLGNELVTAIEAWGSDPRFGRCRRCGLTVAREDVSVRARRKFSVVKRRAATPDPLDVWNSAIADAEAHKE